MAGEADAEAPFEDWHTYRAKHAEYVGLNITLDVPNKLESKPTERNGDERLKYQSGIMVCDANSLVEDTESLGYDAQMFPKRHITPGCTVLIHGELPNWQPTAPFIALCEHIYVKTDKDGRETTNLKVRYFVRLSEADKSVLRKRQLLESGRAALVDTGATDEHGTGAYPEPKVMLQCADKEVFLSTQLVDVEAKHVMHPCIVNCIGSREALGSLALKYAPTSRDEGPSGGQDADLDARISKLLVLRPGFVCCRIYDQERMQLTSLRDAAQLGNKALQKSVDGLLRATRDRLSQARPEWHPPTAEQLAKMPAIPRRKRKASVKAS